MVGAVPLAYLPGVTNDPFNVPKTSLLLVGTAMAGALKILELFTGGSTRGLRRALVPALGLGVPLVAAWVVSPYREWEVWGAYQRLLGLVPSLVVIMFGVLLCDAFRGREGARSLAWSLSISGGLVSLYALVQMLGADPFLDFIPGDFVPSTIGYSNFVGGFLALCVPVSIGLWAQGGKARSLARGVTVLTVLALIGSFSQGGWAAALAGVALFTGVSVSRRHSRARVVGLAVAVAVAALMVGPVLFSAYNGDTARFGGSIATRGLHWETATDIFIDHPWLGRGPSAFLLEGPSYRSPLESMWLDRVVADDPHSVPLVTLVNAGVIGALGYVLAISWIFRKGRAVRPSPLAAAALGSLGAYFAQSLVSIDVITLRFSFWVCLAMLIALGGEEMEPSRVIRRRVAQGAPRRAASVALGSVALLLCVLTGATGVRLLSGDVHAQAGRHAIEEGRTDVAITEFQAAMSLSSMGHYRHLTGEELTAASDGERAMRPELLRLVRAAYREISSTPDFHWMVAHADRLNRWSTYSPHLLPDALEQYRRAQLIDPYNVSVGVRIAGLQLRRGNPSGALRTLQPYAARAKEAPGVIRGYPEIWGAVAIAEWQAGEVEDARESLATAYAMNPDECHVLIARELLGSASPLPLPPKATLELSMSLSCDPSTATLTKLYRTHENERSLLGTP